MHTVNYSIGVSTFLKVARLLLCVGTLCVPAILIRLTGEKPRKASEKS